MPTCVALLRGINVGAHKRIAMSDLRTLVEELGYTNVRTHLNSGNAIFSCRAQENQAIAARIEGAIASGLGMDVPVIVRSAGEMRTIVENNPFPHDAADHTTLHVSFLSSTPEPGAVDALADLARGDDDYRVIGDNVYLYYPNRITGAVFMPKGLDKALNLSSTSRNWRTVTKLAEMTRSAES